jgi:hypothetical protein
MQIFARVDNPPKKPLIGDKIEPLGSQRVGHESRQLEVTCPMYLVMSTRTKKYQFQHVLLHPKK